MMRRLAPLALALWAGGAGAQEVAFLNDSVSFSMPAGLNIARTFGEDLQDGLFAIELAAPLIEDIWTGDGRADELPDMDRMEAAFGLTFPSAACADYAAGASVLPTRCKPGIGMSVIVIARTDPGAGARLGNQVGLLSDEVMALWNAGDHEAILTAFCKNDLHAHRTEVARSAGNVTCISDRPALAPHFLSFRLMLDADFATILFVQNIAAETDVIMTYGIDAFMALIESATDIEAALLAASQDYVQTHGFDATYGIDLFGAVGRLP